MSQIGGHWSVGEYGAVVINLFNPRSHAQFTKQGLDKLGDRETLVYSYKIEQEYSRWRINVDGQTAMPAYHGKVWINPENGRALRVDTEAPYLPHDFPLSSAAGVLYYDDVEIDGQSYLLPSRAENTSCQRDSAFARDWTSNFSTTANSRPSRLCSPPTRTSSSAAKCRPSPSRGPLTKSRDGWDFRRCCFGFPSPLPPPICREIGSADYKGV
jgi:hypothetical protein